MFDAQVGAVIVDSSPEVPARRAGEVPRRPEGRVPPAAVPEGREAARSASRRCSGRSCSTRGVDVIASTNAIHLYPDLPDTVGVVAQGAATRAGTCSSTRATSATRAPGAASGSSTRPCGWSVTSPKGLVRTDPQYAAYLRRPRQRRADEGARRVPRPRVPAAAAARLLPRDARAGGPEGRVGARGEHRGRRAGLVRVPRRRTTTRCSAGSAAPRRSTAAKPSEQAVTDRLALMRHAMDVLFHGRPTFQACWTYITCVNGR